MADPSALRNILQRFKQAQRDGDGDGNADSQAAYCVIDWQSVGVSEGIRDPAYLIPFSLTNDDRLTHEHELVTLARRVECEENANLQKQ